MSADEAATILLVLDDSLKSAILSELEHNELLALTRATSRLGRIDASRIETIANTFYQRMSEPDQVIGNEMVAEKIITNALPTSVAKRVLLETFPQVRSPIDRLMDVPPEHVAKLIHGETPVTIAYILRSMKPQYIASILTELEDSLKNSVIVEMLGNIKPSSTVEDILLKQIDRYIAAYFSSSRTDDEIDAIADVLNEFPSDKAAAVLEHIQQVEPETAERLQRKMFTFEQCTEVPLDELKKAFEIVTPEIIAVAVRGMPQAFCEHLLSALGNRARRMVEQEMTSEANIRAEEIETARKSLVAAILRTRDAK